MKNVEIVKQVLEGDAFWFGGSCKVSEYANESHKHRKYRFYNAFVVTIGEKRKR